MTLREAYTQAFQELGATPEEIRLRFKAGNAGVPDAAQYFDCPVRPGLEREFVDYLKHLFRFMDRRPDIVQDMLRIGMAKRLRAN